MNHLGDITKINGALIEPVDCITGGSPCQDLSVAGKRAGLSGERSGLFMDQVRIVKEMREADVLRGRSGIAVRPRYMVWENVPGAFSSNGGEDFRAVLEEIVRIVEAEVPNLRTVVQGGWTKAGCLYSDMGTWSVAWRLHDAQFWGVPQRRKRIALVADFGGLSAPEILFEREGLSGYFEPGGAPGEEAAGAAGSSIKNSGGGYCLCLNDQGGSVMNVSEDMSGTLGAQANGHEPIILENEQAISFQERGGKPGGGKGILIQIEKTGTISGSTTQMVAGFKHKAGARAGNIGYEIERAPTLNAETTSAVYDARGNVDGITVPTITGDHENRVTDYTAVVMATGQAGAEITVDQSPTLNCNHEQPIVHIPDVAHTIRANPNCAFGEDRETYVAAVDCRNMRENPENNGTLQAKSTGGMSVNLQNVCRTGATVRRLTPLECERLQGYPDGWTDIGDWADTKGKKHKAADSPRYKALGNSIALPFWAWLMKRISAQYERDATLGSLFDGIGGFPYCWERVNGKGSARWASEIEEFPIAVTKLHFPEEESV